MIILCFYYLIHELHNFKSFILSFFLMFNIMNIWGGLDSNRLSAFMMRNPLGMKGIYDFILFPSYFKKKISWHIFQKLFFLGSYCHY